MRYLGNKESLTAPIIQLLHTKGILKENLSCFDAFCGTGAVANSLKRFYRHIIINDLMSWSVMYTKGRLLSNPTFDNLHFDPIEYLNTNVQPQHGFIYSNYSPGASERMYFTAENAERIDYYRSQIEQWYQGQSITPNEYAYLLTCLIEAVSSVSNTAGVYGAFLKHWDARAQHQITLAHLPENIDVLDNTITAYNQRIENIIADVDCDILYLDPPYTQNQYGTQYHLLETLVLNDNPTISKITGSRPVTPLRSAWSEQYKVNILFDKIIAQTQAHYIVLSYNNDGLMSKDFIEGTLKRYGIESTYEVQEIDYKKYNNTKCRGKEGHKEYLFFIEKKKQDDIVYESPLNYAGSKSKMVHFIKENLPAHIDTFIDLFGGGFNVGININAQHIIYNDINRFVVQLLQSFQNTDTYQYIKYITKQIQTYALSPDNPDGYNQLRALYNALPVEQRTPQMLYTLILFGFQQQIRFNAAHEFNNPCGSRRFNDKIISKFISFARVIKEKNVTYTNLDFQELLPLINSDTFVYLDPPYRETRAAYNDGKRGFKGWSKQQEIEMCQFLNSLNPRSVKFMLSYMMDSDSFHNSEIEKWVIDNQYRMKENPVLQGKYNNRREIIIFNY